MRQTIVHTKQQPSSHSREPHGSNDGRNSQKMMVLGGQLCLDEQIMDLEDKSQSETMLERDGAQSKKNRSRNYQLEIRTDPKLEPRSIQIELLNSAGQRTGSGQGQQSFTNNNNNNPKVKNGKVRCGTQHQIVPSSVKSISSPNSGRKVPVSSTKHVPSSNIFQLGSNRHKQKANPKSTTSEADLLLGHKSQPSTSSLQFQPQITLKVPQPPETTQAKKVPATQTNQAQKNYFVQKKELEQSSKEQSNKARPKNTPAKNIKDTNNNQAADVPQETDRVSTISGNVSDDTRNNGLNRAALQDSSQQTQYLSTHGGNGQLHFIYTTGSNETPDLFQTQLRDLQQQHHPYGGGGPPSSLQLMNDQFPTNPSSPLNLMGADSQISPDKISSKFNNSTNSADQQKLQKGSALHYLMKEIPAKNCDLCQLQQGLREIDRALKDRGDRINSSSQSPLSRISFSSQRHQKAQLQSRVNSRTDGSKSKKRPGDEKDKNLEAMRGSISGDPSRISASQFMMKEVLRSKYLECDDYFNCKLTSDIMYNETRHIVSVFKDYLIYDDFSEYMKRFYRHDEATERLPRIFSFYAKYSKVYPNYVALPRESRFMFKNIERKQKLIDQRNRRMQEFQEKMAAEERGIKDVDILLGDKVGDASDPKNSAKFNLFSSQFINNLTDHEFLKQRNQQDEVEPAKYELNHDLLRFNGLDGFEHIKDKKFQQFQASIANRDQNNQRASMFSTQHVNQTNRLSQLLHDISIVSKVDQSQSLVGRSSLMPRGGQSPKSRLSNRQQYDNSIQNMPNFEQPDVQKLDAVPFSIVPSIQCSFITNQPTPRADKANKVNFHTDVPNQLEKKGFDLNTATGDSLKQHFQNEENMAEITSILYNDGKNTDQSPQKDTFQKKRPQGDDEDSEFAVPSEKDDERVPKVEIVEAHKPASKQGQQTRVRRPGREPADTSKKPKQPSRVSGGRSSQKRSGGMSMPGSNERSAKRSSNLSSQREKKNSGGKSNSGQNTASKGLGDRVTQKHLRQDNMKIVTKATQSIIGQAMKNQELLWQAQRSSMLKHAILEVERDNQQWQIGSDKQVPVPDIENELNLEECIDDEFDRNIGQSEDFQNFLNKYMQQKLKQAEQQSENDLKHHPESKDFASNPQPIIITSQVAAAAATAFQQLNDNRKRQQSNNNLSKSGERGSGSLIKNRSFKKTSVKKFTPSSIIIADQVTGQKNHPMVSASDAILIKDVSTGQLLKKLNQGGTGMDRIYGNAASLKKSRKNLSTPKQRTPSKQKMVRNGSRSSRAEDRLAQLGFPKYPLSKKASQQQSRVMDQEADDDEEVPSIDDEYQGLGKNMQERQHQNHQALQRDVSNRKVPSIVESPANRLDRNSNQQQTVPKMQQKIVNPHRSNLSPSHNMKTKTEQRVRSQEKADIRQQQPPRLPMKTKKLSELQILSHGSLKEPSKNFLASKNEQSQIANISQMKFLSSNAGSKASSVIHSKPNSSRKVNRHDSPVVNQKTLMGTVFQQPKARDKISVYPTQKVQTMKSTGGEPTSGIIRKPQGSMYASSEIYIGTDRPTFLKQSTDKSNISMPRKLQARGTTGMSITSGKQVEKMNSQGAFGPKTEQQPTKSVKSDRANSAQLKVPGSSINIRVDPITQNEYVNPAGEAVRTKQEIVPNLQNRGGQPKFLTKDTTQSPYVSSQMQKKRGSAATTMKSYRPNSLQDTARGSSVGSGAGVQAKVIRGTAGQAASSTKQRQITTSSSSVRATYTARNKQLSTKQIRPGNQRPDSINSQKSSNNQQPRNKSGSQASASLLTPSVFSNHHTSTPSQKIFGNRALDHKATVITVQNTQNRTTNASRGNPSAVTGGLKKGSVRTTAVGGLGGSNRVAQASFGQSSGKRAAKKQTIFSVNTSEQR